MAKLPSPWMGLASGIYQGYRDAEDRQYEREDRDYLRADRQASLDLQRQQEARIGDYQKWQMGQSESAQKERLQQQYMKAVSADLTGMDESRKQVFHTYVNSLEQQLGIQPTPYRPGMYDTKPSLQDQAGMLDKFRPEGQTLRPELLGQLAPDLMGKLPQGMQTVPQEAVGERTSAGWATGQPPPAQPRSPYVPVQQQPDPKRLGEYNSLIIRYLKAKEQNANDPMLGSLMKAAAAAYKAATGEDLTQEQWDADNMTAYNAAKIEQGNRRLDITETQGNARISETGRHNKVMEGISQQNADANTLRAKTVNNFKANPNRATATEIVKFYNSLQSQRTALLKGGLFTSSSTAVKEIDALMQEIEPIYRQALGLSGSGSGGGQTGAGSGIDEGYLRRLARKYPSMTSDVLIKQYVGGRDKHYGWDYDETYAILHDERVKMGKK
jgi:hypothetical protein